MNESIKVFVSFDIWMLFEMFFAGPVAELIEGDMGIRIVLLEKSFEGGMGVRNLDSPFSQSAFPIDKLLLADPALSIDVQLFELKPEVVVLLKVGEQISELCL